MALTERLTEVVGDFAKRKSLSLRDRVVHAPDCWNLRVTFGIDGLGAFCIRNLAAGDLPAMHQFGRSLGDRAKELFAPYPWNEPAKLDASFASAIAQSVARVDASYLLERDGEAIGHFFLWKAGGNPQTQAAGLEIPELGVAIADAWQGRGLGSLAVRVLQAVASDLGCDAIELTTATFNDAGWGTYQRAGFEYVGILRIPLGVDVTAAEAGEVQAAAFRDERQMVYVIRPSQRDRVLAYLAAKRGR
jgi:RimJ/RimL family protein N-acetyltransferase